MVKVKLFIRSGKAESGPPLAPILGQNQINLVEFCKLFNVKSKALYSEGTPVRLVIYKQGLHVEYHYKPVTFSHLVKNFLLFVNKSKFLYYTQCYDILSIRLADLDDRSPLNEKQIAKQMFGFLKSTKINLKNG